MDLCYNVLMTRIVLAFVIFLAFAVRGATVDKPMYAEVFLKNTNEKLAGNVTAWDSAGATLRIANKDRTVNWPELTPTSAFTLRQRLIDKTSASDWLALGTMGWQMGLKDQGKAALLADGSASREPRDDRDMKKGARYVRSRKKLIWGKPGPPRRRA